MRKWLGKFNIFYQCSILSAIFLVIISLGLIPLYFIGWKEIPLGILIGLGYGILIYLLFGFLEDKHKEGYLLMITISTFRYFVFALILVFLAICYYVWDFKYFNIIAYVGGYMVCTITLVTLFI